MASWADNVRRERRETAPWHYVDIPIEASAFDEARDGKEHKNVIDKINDFAKVLADDNAPKTERRDALKFSCIFWGTCISHCTAPNAITTRAAMGGWCSFSISRGQ